MSDGQLYQCKGPLAGGATCDIVKREANHWHLVWVDRNGAFGSAPFSEQVITQLKRADIDAKWVCGQGCAQKFYERFLATGKL
jgi:hypothetical protein